MTPGQRIRKLRVQNNLGQQALADQLGYQTYTTISKWEADKSLPPGNKLMKLAHFFGVSVDYILGSDNSTKINEIIPLANVIGLGFFESINEALLAKNLTDDHKDKITVPQLTLKEKKDHYFVLTLKTDSINQLIPASYNIIVLDFSAAEDKSLQTGDIIIVQLKDEYKVITLRKTNGMIYSEPSSFIDGYETVAFTTEEFEKLHLIGKIIAAYKTFD